MVESVSYSQCTANRLMQLFEEYGDKLFASTDDGGRSNSSALTNLTYYQAFLLLGISEDEREKFILQHVVKDMTTRELDQALKERNQTAPEKVQDQVTPMPNNPQDIKIEYVTVKKTANPLIRESALACFTTGYAFPDRNEITAGTPLIVFRLFPYTNISRTAAKIVAAS